MRALKNYLILHQGFKVSANKNAIKLKRYEDNTQKVYTLNLQELYKMTPKDGDIISIYPKSTISAKYVVLKGNIVAPGEKEIPKDKKLSTLLKNELEKFTKDGFFLKNTYYDFGTITNENKIKTFNLQKVLDGKEDISLKIWDEIEIYKISSDDFIEVTGDIVDKNKTRYRYFEGLKLMDLFNIVLFKKAPGMQVDDRLVHVTRVVNNKIETFSVPKEQLKDFEIKPFDKIKFFNFSNINEDDKATIKGEVFLSGTYSISENTTINDLVKLSGGFTKKALKSRFELARYTSNGYERTREIYQLDLADALKKNLKIFPDDEITIFPIANWNEKKYIEIKGLVRFPGKYPIVEGGKTFKCS